MRQPRVLPQPGDAAELAINTLPGQIIKARVNSIVWGQGQGQLPTSGVLPQTGEELGVEVKESAHSTYLRFLGEMGVLGLVLFVLLLWRCWSLAWQGMRRARDAADRQLALGLAAAVLAWAVSCAFGDRFLSVLIAGNVWIACALVDDLVGERRAEGA